MPEVGAPVPSSTTYEEIIARLQELNNSISETEAEYNQKLLDLSDQVAQQEALRDAIEAGLDVSDYETFIEVMQLEWSRGWKSSKREVTQEVLDQINTAINQLRTASDYMLRNYLGVKSYDCFPSQINNSQKGYGPRHGSIWWRINYRSASTVPTQEQRLSCIRVLIALSKNPQLPISF